VSVAVHVEWRSLTSSSSTGPIVFFHGRLDNRAHLERVTGSSRTTSDTDVIARGIGQRGLVFLDALLGDYALVVIEPQATRVHLVRDPTGQRPLLYCRDADGVRCGLLPRELGLPLRVDLDRLAGIVAGAAIQDRLTAFASIHSVRPGEIVTITPSSTEGRYWWHPPAEPEAHAPDRDYAGEYVDLLAQATASRLQPGPVASHLSGGWDSSAVTATAAGLIEAERLTAYTSVPWQPVTGALMRHSNADEGLLASATADLWGIRHRKLGQRLSPFASARTFAALSQAPVFDAFQIGWWHAIHSAARADGALSLLTAENGNLSLNASGLPMLRWLVRERSLLTAGREARDLVRAGQVRWRGAAAAILMGRLSPRIMHWGLQTFGGGAQPDDATFINRAYSRAPVTVAASDNPHADRLALMRNSDPGVHRVLAAREWHLAETDPTADRRLIEWSLRLPSETLLHRGELRPMARAALTGRVASSVLASNLRGLQGADWYQQVTAADCTEVLGEVREHSLVREFIDVGALERAIGQWPSTDWNSPENYGRYRMGVVGALCTGLFIAQYAA